MADNSPPMVVGIRHTNSATSTVMVTGAPALATATLNSENGSKRRGRQQEHQRQRDQQNGQRDFVRRLLPLGALDHGDHAIDEGLARD